MAIIHKDFAAGLHDLNRTILHDGMVALKNGDRAYLLDGKPYAGAVHFQPIGEKYEDHLVSAQTLEDDNNVHGKIYVGFGGMVNLEFLGAARCRAGVLGDINPLQTYHNNFVIEEGLAKIEEPEDFCDFLIESSRTAASEYQKVFPFSSMSCRYDLEKAIKVGTVFRDGHPESVRHWLHWWEDSSDVCWQNDPGRRRYKHLHQMARLGALGAITIDVCVRAACEQLKRYMNERGVNAGIIYRSNILDYLDFPRGGRPRGVLTQARSNMDLWLSAEADNQPVVIEGKGILNTYEPQFNDSYPYGQPALQF